MCDKDDKRIYSKRYCTVRNEVEGFSHQLITHLLEQFVQLVNVIEFNYVLYIILCITHTIICITHTILCLFVQGEGMH